MNRMLALAGFALLPLAAAPSALAAPAKPAVADWSKRTAASTDGGFVMGNPQAKVTLVEYGSLTCSHCRHFAETGMKPLTANYIRTGKVRYEFRNYILNGYDLAASIVARCGGARTFFPIADTLYATQDKWIDTIRKTPKAKLDAIEALPDDKQVAAMADVGGFKAVAAAKGVPVAASTKCLADPMNAKRLIVMTGAAQERYGVNGTPTFFVNGKQIAGNDWPSVEAALKAAL